MQIRMTQVTVLPEGASIYDERGIKVSIEDEGAGEYIEILSLGGSADGVVKIDPEEWPTLRDAINKMIDEIKANDEARAAQ